MQYKVTIETDIIDRPKDHELKLALFVANEYFKSDVIFLRQDRYTTPDLRVGLELWEMKSPLGGGKKTIENNLRLARKQSKNLILDFTRMKLHQTKALANTNHYLKKSNNHFHKVVIITKNKKILEIL